MLCGKLSFTKDVWILLRDWLGVLRRHSGFEKIVIQKMKYFGMKIVFAAYVWDMYSKNLLLKGKFNIVNCWNFSFDE